MRGRMSVSLRNRRGAEDDDWIVDRHATVNAPANGFGPQHARDVADIVQAFAAARDPVRERCWIAEVEGEWAGCVYLIDEGDGWGRLRLLYVRPWARGRGAGEALVTACVGAARAAGYAGVVLWTMSTLAPARRLYEAAGFRMVEQRPHAAYGVEADDETWRLAFAP